ncbi:heavy metal translocating P-type ATPase, partial [Mycobacterium sp. ITM-2017-0098]
AGATVEGRRVRVGKLPVAGLTAPWAKAAHNRARLDSAAIAWVEVDGEAVGAILLRDPLRRDASRTIRRLRGAG